MVPSWGQTPCELWSIDVHERGLDCRAVGLYRIGDVTGSDFKVQAVMLTQGDTVCGLLDAVEAIEAHGLRAFILCVAVATGSW